MGNIKKKQKFWDKKHQNLANLNPICLNSQAYFCRVLLNKSKYPKRKFCRKGIYFLIQTPSELIVYNNPFSAKKCSASKAAIQPVPAEVIA